MAPTFTDLVRGQSDEALAALVRARPDLIVPMPADLSGLAARAQSRLSVTRMLDQLNRFQLEILDAIRLTRDPQGVSSLNEVLAITAAPPGRVEAGRVRGAVGQLRGYLLVYGSDEQLQVLPAVDDVLGPHPAGLGRPAAELAEPTATLVSDPARLRRTLLSAPPAARAVLERLAAGPPVGATAEEPADDSPVAWLVSRDLLVATGPGAVELPREIGLLLRRDTGPAGELHPDPPELTGAPLEMTAVDAAGAGQAMSAVQRTEAVLGALAAEPAPVLRSGGLGVRDLRRLARAAGVDEPTAAVLVEVAEAAGLIGQAEPERVATARSPGGGRSPGGARSVGGSSSGGESTFRPTSGYDSWSTASLAAQWHTLAVTWLSMTRQPGLVGQRDSRGRPIGALTPEVTRSGAPAARRTVLGVLAGLAPGAAPSGDEVLALVAWHAPRWAAGREPVARQVLAEAALLGVTGKRALTSYGDALLAEARAPAEPDDDPLGLRAAGATPAGLPGSAGRLAALLPDPVDELLVQADLTVVVPGPPEPALAAELELVGEPESAGGASVHRVTRDSVRRALDAGYTAEDLHALFNRRSRTPVPQALTYLIDDVARAHGGLRVGAVTAYLRSDDEALVAQVLADRRLASLGLRRLAPTVLVCAGANRTRLLSALREAGYAPVPEDGSGAALLVRPRGRRAPARPATAAPVDPFAPTRMTPPRLLGIIEDLRRGEAAARARRAQLAGGVNGQPAAGTAAQAHAEAMAVLQQAVRDKALVRVGYVDGHGARTSRLVRPVSIGAGYLRAEDERTDTLHTFALHRITGAAIES